MGCQIIWMQTHDYPLGPSCSCRTSRNMHVETRLSIGTLGQRVPESQVGAIPRVSCDVFQCPNAPAGQAFHQAAPD